MASGQARDALLSREAIISAVERLHRIWGTGDISLIPETYAAGLSRIFPPGGNSGATRASARSSRVRAKHSRIGPRLSRT